MLKRIPHDDQGITGERTTEEYLRKHQKYVRIQYKPFLQALAKQIENRRLSPQGRFLEIGSGPGILTGMIAAQYPQVEMNALELSADMISLAKKIVGSSHPACRVRFIEASVNNSQAMVHLGKFDLVYSTFSLHHWEKPIEAIKSMYQSIKAGGLMLLYDLKRVPWLYVLPTHNGFLDSIRAAYRSNEIQRILAQARIDRFSIKTPFPYFWHLVKIRK